MHRKKNKQKKKSLPAKKAKPVKLVVVATKKFTYNSLLKNIGTTLQAARENSISFLNQQLLNCYWEIGKHIIEYEQEGNVRAEYGTALLNDLSRDLQEKFGRGFGRSNIYMMRQFYSLYPKFPMSQIGRASCRERV